MHVQIQEIVKRHSTVNYLNYSFDMTIIDLYFKIHTTEITIQIRLTVLCTICHKAYFSIRFQTLYVFENYNSIRSVRFTETNQELGSLGSS